MYTNNVYIYIILIYKKKKLHKKKQISGAGAIA